MTIDIRVAPVNIDGVKWDDGNEVGPDIYVCLADSQGQRCIVRNPDFTDSGGAAWCEEVLDGTPCIIERVLIRDAKVKIQVIDKDWFKEETVATGVCSTDGSTCNLGLATVVFR